MGGYELTILALKKFQCKDYLNWAGLPRRDWGIIGFSEAPPYLAGSFNITSKCPFYAVGNGAGSPLMASPRLFDPHVYKAWKLLKPSLAIPRSIAKAAGGLVTGQARLGSASYHLVQARFHYDLSNCEWSMSWNDFFLYSVFPGDATGQPYKSYPLVCNPIHYLSESVQSTFRNSTSHSSLSLLLLTSTMKTSFSVLLCCILSAMWL
jgi:hypothetical protein